MSPRPRTNPALLVAAAWTVPALLGVINEVAQRRLTGQPPPATGVLLFAAATWLVYGVLTPAVFAVSRRWPLARPRLLPHVVIHVLLSLVFCAGWAAAVAGLRALALPAPPPGGINLYFTSWLLTTLQFGIPMYFAIAGIEHAIRHFFEARDRELQMARLSEQLSGARFAALQAQVNPHFLFNTLNTIAVLIGDGDKAGAGRVVEQLSDVLRRTLGRADNEVALGQELELVRQYLAIEQARFSDRLQVSYLYDEAVLSAGVPSFAVQHLVENAIRHGIAKEPEAGRVTVTARRDGNTLEVAVTDDGPGINGQPPPPGHGIMSTRERLRALYGDRASLELQPGAERGCVATLRLPHRELS